MRSASPFGWLATLGAVAVAAVCCAVPLVLAATGISLATIALAGARLLPVVAVVAVCALLGAAVVVRLRRRVRP